MTSFIKNIKHSYRIVMSNKLRYVLTAIGIIVAIIIFTAGSFISECFSYKDINKYETFNKNIVLINQSIDVNNLPEINLHTNGRYSYYKWQTAFITTLKEKNNVSIMFDLYGVNKEFNYLPIPSIIDDDNVDTAKLIAGRPFSDNDMLLKANNMILNKTFAELFFGRSDAIGEQINVNDKNFTVIGILSDTYDIKQISKKIQDSFRSDEYAYINARAYVPHTLASGNSAEYTVWNASENVEKTASIIDAVCGLTGNNKSCTYDRLVYLKIDSVISTRFVLQVGMMLLLLIASASIAVVIVFSLKERIGEIGIKKAIGATNSDITIQFTFEALFMASLTSLIGIIVGLIVGFVVVLILGFNYFLLNYGTILLPLFANFFICLLSSLIPSIVAAKYNIVSSLRFE